MANRTAPIKQNDAKRLFKAALEAGFDAAKIVIHPDGRIEASGSRAGKAVPAVDVALSPFEQWKTENANKD